MSQNQKNEKEIQEMSQQEIGLRLVQLRQMFNANLMQENSRLFILVFSLFVGVCIALTNYYIIVRKSTPPYYVTVNENNQYIAPVPLHEPLYNENSIKARALKASQSLISYDYFSYVQQINEKRFMFTESGWTSYQNALKNSQTIDMIKEYKMIVKFKPSKTPVILRQGVMDNGQYGWEIEVMGEFQTQRQDPVTRQIESRSYKAKVIMTWVRESIHKYEDGIALQRFELTYPK